MRGFTLIEIMVVVSISVIISSMIFLGLYSFGGEYNLKRTTEETVSLLERAKSLSINSYNGSKHGIYFTATSAHLFAGDVWNSDSIEYTMSYANGVSLATSSFTTSSTTVIFEKITGETNTYGSLKYYLKNNPTSSSTIQINKTGIIKR
jgi:prepilin-type N-terminal cleavage/methylation domain-containing protein